MTDIIRYAIVGIVFILGCIFTWDYGKETQIAYLCLTLMCTFTIRFSRKAAFIQDILYPVYALVVGLFIGHYLTIINHDFFVEFPKRSVFRFIAHQGLESIIVELLFIPALYFFLRTVKIPARFAAIIAPFPTILISLADHIVYTFRSSELSPTDLTAIGTAMSVAGNYQFPVRIPMLFAYIPFALYVFSLVRIKEEKHTVKKPLAQKLIPSVIYLVIAAGFTAGLLTTVKNISEKKYGRVWGDEASSMTGYVTNFALLLNELRIDKPEGYIRSDFEGITAAPAGNASSADDINIIVIMNESYTDITIFPDTAPLRHDPSPFWHELTTEDNVLSGFAYSSVFGGVTANSEFEMLTGLSVSGLPNGAVPYSMYLGSPVYSLPEYLRELGYSTTAMHPFIASGWNRDIVYPNLGFDNSYFIEDFVYDEEDILRGSPNLSEDLGFISDMCAYRNLLRFIDEDESGAPGFYFLVTIQNHGGYFKENELLEFSRFVSGSENDEQANIFLSNIRRSDDALEMLVSELQNRDERYMLLIFGDHQPSLEDIEMVQDGFYPGGRKWMVPYLIWTNYDMPQNVSGSDVSTSLNYLALDVLRASEIPYSPYFEYVSEIRDVIPCINSTGFLYADSDRWYDITSANQPSEAVEYLNQYQRLMYYSLFDS